MQSVQQCAQYNVHSWDIVQSAQKCLARATPDCSIPAVCSVQLCRETHFNYPLSLEDFRTDCSISVPSWLQRPDSYQRVHVPVQ